MIQAIHTEILIQKDLFPDTTINTIYFGGGTPSLLSRQDLDAFLNSLNKNFKLNSDIEITLEANPDDLTLEKIIELKKAGINRLSIGTQTFDNELLKFLNRAHNNNEAVKSIENALLHFNNISVDLIYGIHKQSDKVFEHDLNQLIKLKPQHISAYSLTIEGNNAFSRWRDQGKLEDTDDELSVSHFKQLTAGLSKAGYGQYEISNFSLPGYESKHNSSYWFGKPYLGLGPSAHSFNGTNRLSNIPNNAKYVAAIEEGIIPFHLDILSEKDKINEFIMTRLRTKWGIDLEELRTRYNYSPNEEQNAILDSYYSSNHLSLNDQTITLTESGKLIADQIASDLFLL